MSEVFDEFIYKYKIAIGGALVVIILLGSGLIIFEKINRQEKEKNNKILLSLKQENDLLRQELSVQASRQVAGVSSSENQAAKININIASLEELDKLQGVGPARAADIISYRETNNGFKNIEEIKNIKGIGDKIFESMKDLITIGE